MRRANQSQRKEEGEKALKSRVGWVWRAKDRTRRSTGHQQVETHEGF